MSLGSLAGVVGTYAILIPLTISNRLSPDYLLYAFGGTAIVIYQHRSNIVALFKGIERKLGQRAEKVRAHSGHQKQKDVVSDINPTGRDACATKPKALALFRKL